MPVNQELEKALAAFREDLLKALTDLKVDIVALDRAILEPNVTKERLQQLREDAKKSAEKIHERYALSVGPANTRR